MGVLEAVAQPRAQALQVVNGQAANPGIQRQGVLQEAGLLGIAAALIVARGSGVDESIVQQDPVTLLVVLALLVALYQLVGGCGVWWLQRAYA